MLGELPWWVWVFVIPALALVGIGLLLLLAASYALTNAAHGRKE